MSRHALIGLAALLATALSLLLRLFFAQDGHFGFDDMHYARLSAQVASGTFATTHDHYTFRWPLILLNGAVFYLLGISDYTAAIVPITATLATAGMVWRMGRHLSLTARVFAVFMTAWSEWIFFYSTKIMPDILILLAATAMLWLWYEGRHGALQKHPFGAGSGLAAAFFFGFLSKETLLLLAPFWAFVAAKEVQNGVNKRFWSGAIGSGAVLFGLYFAWMYGATGHLGGRFRAIAENAYFNACSYDQLPVEHLFRRIGYELWRVFFETGVAAGIILLLASRRLSASTPERQIQQTAWWWLLLSNFMSISPTHYVPLCPDIRHYLFVVPPLALVSAHTIEDYLRHDPLRRRDGRLPVLAIGAALMAAWKFPAQLLLYGVFAGGALLALWGKWKHNIPAGVMWIPFFVMLAIKPVDVFRAAQKSNWTEQKRIVHEYLDTTAPTSRSLTVITNQAEKNMDEYLLRFDTSQVRWLTFKTATPEAVASSDSVVLLLNGATAWMSNTDWDKLPLWVRQPDQSRQLIATGAHIELFGLQKDSLLRRIVAEQATQ